MRRPRFSVDWRDGDDVRIIWVVGEIDLSAADTLRHALDCDQPRLEVDLSQVTFMDLSGLACLLDAVETHRVVLVNCSPRVDRLLELTDSGPLFERV